jgi:hypothetical protein
MVLILRVAWRSTNDEGETLLNESLAKVDSENSGERLLLLLL